MGVRDSYELALQNAIARGPTLDFGHVERQVLARDREVRHRFSKDAQLMAIANARRYLGDKLRTARPHRLLDPNHGPLIGATEHPHPQDTRSGASRRTLTPR